MQDKEARAEETLEWLRYGDSDFQSAVVLLDVESPLLNSALFHCQQAVEKWLKAFLIWNGIAFPKVHDLHRIGAMCSAIETDLQTAISPVVDLTDFATVYRYPGAEILVEPEDARQWRDLASRVRAAVLEKLPPEIRDSA